MFSFQNLLKLSTKRTFVFSSLKKQHLQIVNKPLNTFFWNKKGNDNEAMKKFKEMNKDFKNVKQAQRFTINRDKVKTYLSDEERKKQEKILKNVFEEYITTYKFDTKFDEIKFIALLAAISYTYENSFILNDPRFQELIKETASNIRDFKIMRNLIQFLSFCSTYGNVQDPLIWENFNSVIRNYSKNFSFEDKITILSSINEANASELEEFFELFENDFIKSFTTEKGTTDYNRLYRTLALYRSQNKGNEIFH